MRLFTLDYQVSLTFDRPVQNQYFALRCIPFSNHRQTITHFTLSVTPDCALSRQMDSFGNQFVSGGIAAVHGSFSFCITGEAKIHEGKTTSDFYLPVYRYPSAYTRHGATLAEFFGKLQLRGQDNLTKAMELSNHIYTRMRYDKKSTDTKTTAEQAFAVRAGVCQDYTHILLTLCRMAGIPCRYCAGLASCDGETHSWAEIWQDGSWYGIDPTNNIPADGGYLKLSHGRDFGDCAIDRGVFMGLAAQKQTVESRLLENQQ